MAEPVLSPNQVPGSWAYGAANSGNESARAQVDAGRPGDGYPSFVADNAWDAKLSGSMRKGDYDAWRLESESAREAREYERFLADTAWQRKVRDLQAAGFSPLAALEATGQGAPIVSAHVAKASNTTSSPNMAGVISALIAAVAMVASKGAAAATSAKSAEKIARLRLAARMRRF